MSSPLRNLGCSFLLLFLLFALFRSPVYSQGNMPSNYEFNTGFCRPANTIDNGFPVTGGYSHMGLNGKMLSGIGFAGFYANEYLDANFQRIFRFKPLGAGGNVNVQSAAIDGLGNIWYGYCKATESHFSKISPTGSIISQYYLPGYELGQIMTDTLGRVHCILYNSSSFCHLRYQPGASTPDFQHSVNTGSFNPGYGTRDYYKLDHRIYVENNGMFYVMDLDGNLLQTIQAPTAFKLLVFEDHSLATVSQNGSTAIVVERFSSAGISQWCKRYQRPGTPYDSLVTDPNGIAIPGRNEALVIFNSRESYSVTPSPNCNSSNTMRRAYGMNIDAQGQVFNSFGIGSTAITNFAPYTALNTTLHGAPMLSTFRQYCITLAYGPYEQDFWKLQPYGNLSNCSPASGIQATPFPSFGPLVLGTGSFSNVSLGFITEAPGINFINTGIVQTSACPLPCLRMDSIIVQSPGRVQFYDQILYQSSILYDFGDGTTTTTADPLHQYAAPGNYNVSIIVSNSCGSDTLSFVVNPCDTAQILGPNALCLGDTAHFQLGSGQNPDSLNWLVDGVAAGNGANLNWLFTTAGNHLVELVHHSTPCRDTSRFAVFIYNSAPSPAFSMSFGNHSVQFSNTSSQASSYHWDFGDGATSTLANPSHNYAGNGPYNVCLSAYNNCDTSTICQTTCAFAEADFTFLQNGSLTNFSFMGANASNYSWDFGDGGSSTSPNPSHAYSNSGNYNVCLIVSNACNSDTICKSLSVSIGNNSQWLSNLDSLGTVSHARIAMDANSEIMVVGKSNLGDFMLRTDAGGNLLWLKFLAPNIMDMKDICLMSSGHFLVAGGYHPNGGSTMNFGWMEVDAQGNILSSNYLPASGNEYAFKVRKSLYGGYTLSGRGGSIPGYPVSGRVLKMDGNLNAVWQNSAPEIIYDAIQIPDSSYWMVGRVWANGQRRIQMLHANAQGVFQEFGPIDLTTTTNLLLANDHLEMEWACGKLIIAAEIWETVSAIGNDVSQVALVAFNTANNNFSKRVVGFSTNGSYIHHDATLLGLSKLNDNQVVLGGYTWDHNYASNGAKKQIFQMVVDGSLNISNSEFSGLSAQHDIQMDIFSPSDNRRIAIGTTEGKTFLRKANAATCQIPSQAAALFYMSPLPVSGTLFPTTTTINSGIASHGAFAANTFTHNGLSQIACVSNCSNSVTAGFNVNQVGNNLSLTSTSTAGSILNWLIPGISCASASTASYTLACGTNTLSLVASNGCAVDTFSQTFNLSANLSIADQTVCPGSNATFSLPSGFSNPTWSNGSSSNSITLTSPGSYGVTATSSSGCAAQDTFQLSNFTPPSVSLSNQTVCPGDPASFDAGPGFASYAWSNGASTQSISVSTAGTYSVTVTDANGCTGSASATLSNFAAPTVFLGNDTSIVSGNSITLNAGSFSSYLWSTNATSSSITVNSAGTFSVTVTDANGCTASDTIEINLLPQPNINISYNGMTITATGNPNGMSSYAWTFGNGATGTGQTASYTYTTPGTYQVCLTVTYSNGQTATTCMMVTVPGPVAIGQPRDYVFSLSPNPSQGRLKVHIELPETACPELELIDISGKILLKYAAECQQSQDLELNLEQLSNGSYFLRMMAGEIADTRKLELIR